MSFSSENGYIPVTFSNVMEAIRLNINIQFGTTFTIETFVGTNWYKYFYTLVQRVLQSETKTAEIFEKLKQYISTTNQSIQRPSVSIPGLIDSFESYDYVASVKKNLIGDAGTISICVDTDEDADDYPDVKLEICNLIKHFVVAGMVSLGTETESIVLSNGQSFDFSFYLPDYTPVVLRLTLNVSDNQLVTLPTDEQIRGALNDNINARYRLGWDFEPQRYYTMVDVPWAATILLEWSDDDGANWHSTVFEAGFRDLFTFGLEDITVVVTP